MSDRLLKQLVTDHAVDFATWLLGRAVESAEALPTDLPDEPRSTDLLLRVQQDDSTFCLLHLEFQGRRSPRPMPLRMLDYMARLVQLHGLPLQSVVIYLESGAGRNDTGQHQHLQPNGTPALRWHYQVVALWQMQAEELLALGRRSLLPLIGMTQITQPATTLPQVVAALHAEPDMTQRLELFRQFIGLLKDEELVAMTRELITDLDLEELREFPFLWEQYQRYHQQARDEGKAEGIAEGKAEGIAETARAKTLEHILEGVVLRFNPSAASYREIEKALHSITDLDRLSTIFRYVFQATDYAAFEQAVLNPPAV